MPIVARLKRGAALLIFVTAVATPSAYAEDPIEPPQARINPPGGFTSQARISPPTGNPTTDARIHPPGGTPQSDARINPPIGVTSPEPSFFQLLVEWLRAQARIHPPIG